MNAKRIMPRFLFTNISEKHRDTLMFLRKLLSDEPQERANEKAQRHPKPTGKRVSLIVIGDSVPESRNWLRRQQKQHLIDDLMADVIRFQTLHNRIDGWTPPRGEEAEELEQLEKRFQFVVMDELVQKEEIPA